MLMLAHPPWLAWIVVGLIVSAVLGWRATRRPLGGARATRQETVDLFRGARIDPLTGLPNRQSFTNALAARLAGDSPSALLLIDLDGFGELNTSHGHRAGDEVLVAASDRLRRISPDLHQLGRLGGDEFALVLDAAGGAAAVELAAVGVLRAMTEPLRTGPHDFACGVSLGIALAPDHGRDPDTLLNAAQSALCQAKDAGGGTWTFFDLARGQAERMRTQLMEELRVAVGGSQITPYYQPIVELRTGHVVGLEVLARWEHPTRGLLVPDTFIPMAEEMQLAGLLSQALMRRVIADAREWSPRLYFAFNVSPGQLRELIAMIRTPPAWPEGVLDPCRLEIEVTESAMIEDIDIAREVIGLLQSRGTRVVLDDFGTGFSNFLHLRELPFDRIKIDKSFVIDIAHDPRAEACVRAMLALGHSLGVDMVAEGIESAETASFVTALGCRFGQGFHYAEPVPSSSVAALLRRLSADAAMRLAAVG